MQKKLIILGAGNFAEEVFNVAKESGFDYVSCFVEGIDPEKSGKKIAGIPVIWIDDLEKYDDSFVLLCGIGSPKRKNLIERVLVKKIDFTNVIHPSAIISSTTHMGNDIYISAGTILAAACSIADHVIINRAAVIGHNVTIANYVTISPGANIGGGTTINEGSFIGMGAIILDKISIGQNSIVGAGAVVTKNIPDNVQVMGIPARITKELK